MPAHDDILSSLNQRKTKTISDAIYTIGDWGEDTSIQYDVFSYTSLTANRAITLPTLSANDGYEFDIINLDGSYNVVITPEGTDDINDWNETFEITEKHGRVKILGLADRWLLVPLNDACIYEVSTETADTGLTLNNTWDDVSGMTLLNGIYGKGKLYSSAIQEIADSSVPTYIYGYWGIGTTSGNNAPEIFNPKEQGLNLANQEMEEIIFQWNLNNYDYESDGSTIYMKAKVLTDELDATGHRMRGQTNGPMFIKWIRKY